jgi:GTP cyclohydrolase IA
MSDTNSNLYPTAAAANGFPLVSSNGSSAETRSALQTFRSFTSGLRRPFTSIVAQFSASRSIASDRLSYSPPSPPTRREGPLPPQDLALVDSEELIREILIRVGEDPDREGLQQTPARIIRSWKEIYGGYEQRSEEILVTQFCAGQYDEMVLLRDIEFYSTCEHHMLPFYGKAHIAYLPNNKIVGLSKLARLLDMHARRLQVQERLTQQVATELQRILRPKGVAVMIEGKHQCMCCRGVRKQAGKMVTSCMLGLFKENLTTRGEFLALARKGD